MRQGSKRACALALAVILGAGLALPAGAAELSAAYDETYYATLDYYGGLTDASVVKSYRPNGQRVIADRGSYRQVINLTDRREPALEEGLVTFTFEEEAPATFYFEGKTDQPFLELPWSIAVSYRLNGAPILAEELAGRAGLVEILIDVMPRPGAGEYARSNLVLTVAAAFNGDDITSLEAPGAQVQLIGNLRAVLFAVLPGEEQHFALRVGSDSFESTGLLFLAVPATLEQLEQVADLRETRDKTQDSLNAINDSLDVILNTLDGMSGSLNTAAGGLEQLNSARGSVSAGKGAVYGGTDAALADLEELAGQLEGMEGYLSTASQALADTTALLNELTATAVSTKEEMARTRDLVADLQRDIKRLKEMSLTAEGYNSAENRKIVTDLSKSAKSLNDDMEELTTALNILRTAVERLKTISVVTTAEMEGLIGTVTREVGGERLPVAEIQRRAAFAQEFQAAYTRACVEAVTAGGQPPEMAAYLAVYLGTTDPAQLQTAGEELAWVQRNQSQLEELEEELEQAQGSLNAGVRMLNKRITEANSLITQLRKPTSGLLKQLAYVSENLGEGGFTDDLEKLTKLCDDLMRDLEPYNGTLPALLGDLDGTLALAADVTVKADALLEDLDGLNGVLNTYEPQAQAALADAAGLSAAARDTLRDTRTALSAAEELLRKSGPALDGGTSQSLSGVSEALRRSAAGLEQTGTIRQAKTTIHDLLSDEWDAHSGQVDTLLLMDAAAAPVSMTSAENPAPSSIQYIMRTREIKVEQAPAETAGEGPQAEARTFLQRIGDMFVGIWTDIVGFFTRSRD